MPTWDPDQYLRFADHRTRPLRELLARVPHLPAAPTVLDIGCGPGNSTAVLRERWPDADITGIDSSAEMLATARSAEGEPSAAYLLADATTYDPAPAAPDLIATNATLQWIDGHLDLLPRWAEALRPGGAIALQVPSNFDQPSHILLDELRRGPRWRERLGDLRLRPDMPEPDDYLHTLLGAGCTADVWETTYRSLLPGTDPVLEWMKGTGLRPVLGHLTDPAEREAFLAEYGALLREAYPTGPHGTVFPFHRVFAVGVRR
ncbi:methyltransferase domain-containing protein [Kitasatospora sp. NPDC088346]|uniref:methyltransferase domain-containing protein n=1 Tax=Kitasatospora sp. NPDC088346 TaxID=3364073 RepID=UPI003822B731